MDNNGLDQTIAPPTRAQRGRPSAKNAGVQTPKRAYPCDWENCTKSFGRKSDLQRHVYTHTGTRNHKCDWQGCGKTFIQTSALTVHRRTHTGEKPHSCHVCTKSFSDSSSLARHRKIHSNERPYPCRITECNKTFCRKTTLTKHYERDHPGLPIPAQGDEDVKAEYPASNLAEGPQFNNPWPTSLEANVSPFSSDPSMTAKVEPQSDPTKPSPFRTMPTKGSPDPGTRNYPHPDLCQHQVQNVTANQVRGFHPNMAQAWQPINTAIPSSHVSSVQPSPSTLSSGSSAVESQYSQEFALSATSAKSGQFPYQESHQGLPAYVSSEHRNNSCPSHLIGMGLHERNPARHALHMHRHSFNGIQEVSDFDYQPPSELPLSGLGHTSPSMVPGLSSSQEQEIKLGRLEQMQSNFQQIHTRPHTAHGSMTASYNPLDYHQNLYQEPMNLGILPEASVQEAATLSFLGDMNFTLSDKFIDSFDQPMPSDVYN